MPGIAFAGTRGGTTGLANLKKYLLANGLAGSGTPPAQALYGGDLVALTTTTNLTGSNPLNVEVLRMLLAADKTAHYKEGTPIAGILGVACDDVTTSGNQAGANNGGLAGAPPAIAGISTGAAINYPLSYSAMMSQPDVATGRSWERVWSATGNIFAARFDINSTTWTATATIQHQYDGTLAGFNLNTYNGQTIYTLDPGTGLDNVATGAAAADQCVRIIGVDTTDPLFNVPIVRQAQGASFSAYGPIMFFEFLAAFNQDLTGVVYTSQ